MDTTPLTHISEQTEVASTRVDYAKFHSQLQIPLDSFSTYATELLNWSERDVKVTFEEVLKGMEIIAELIDKEEDKAAWKETVCLTVFLLTQSVRRCTYNSSDPKE